jgi:hypothetical protein
MTEGVDKDGNKMEEDEIERLPLLLLLPLTTALNIGILPLGNAATEPDDDVEGDTDGDTDDVDDVSATVFHCCRQLRRSKDR